MGTTPRSAAEGAMGGLQKPATRSKDSTGRISHANPKLKTGAVSSTPVPQGVWGDAAGQTGCLDSRPAPRALWESFYRVPVFCSHAIALPRPYATHSGGNGPCGCRRGPARGSRASWPPARNEKFGPATGSHQVVESAVTTPGGEHAMRRECPHPWPRIRQSSLGSSVASDKLTTLHEMPSTSSDWTARQPHARGWLG